MRIGELSRKTGKTARTLHFYEELGLLRPSGRTKGGFRVYDDGALLRVRWIERLQDLGFSLQEIQDFLVLLQEKAHGPDAMGELRSFYAEKIDEVEKNLARLRALKRDLSESIDYLDGCRSCDPLTQRSDCAVCTPEIHAGQSAPAMVAAVHPGEP